MEVARAEVLVRLVDEWDHHLGSWPKNLAYVKCLWKPNIGQTLGPLVT